MAGRSYERNLGRIPHAERIMKNRVSLSVRVRWIRQLLWPTVHWISDVRATESSREIPTLGCWVRFMQRGVRYRKNAVVGWIRIETIVRTVAWNIVGPSGDIVENAITSHFVTVVGVAFRQD
jgi:hypothetical protein